jgi:hypothetical protein
VECFSRRIPGVNEAGDAHGIPIRESFSGDSHLMIACEAPSRHDWCCGFDNWERENWIEFQY